MKRRRITTQLVISILLIVSAVIGCTAGAYMVLLTRNFNRSMRDEITAGREAMRLKVMEGTRRAQLIARFAASDPDARRLTAIADGNPKAVSDVDFPALLERFRRIAPDAGIITILDSDGRILAQMEPMDPMATSLRDRRGEPLFLNPLFASAAAGKDAAGIELCLPDVLCIDAFEAIRKPADRRQLIGSLAAARAQSAPGPVVGYVRIGLIIGDAFAREVKLATGTDLFILRRDRGAATSLPHEKFTPAVARQLAESVAGRKTRGNRGGAAPEISLGGEPYVLDPEAIVDAGGREIGLRVIARNASSAKQARHDAVTVLAAIAALALVLALALSMFTVKRISKPLGELLARVREIAAGKLDSESIPLTGQDEIGELAGAFNEMTRSLAERDRLLRESADELQQNQDQLIQSGKLAAIGELAAGIAHEIGNPLSAISGYAQMIQEQTHSPTSQGEFAKEIEREADFIERIIHDLLEFSRPSEKKFELANIQELAEAAIKTVSAHKAFANVKIERRFAPGIPAVPCYKKEIQQVFLNLIMNAAQAMPKGGTIYVEGEKTAEGALFRVRDTGPGVPPNIKDKIFNPFFTTKPPGVGTGLGLAITYRIIEKHGGRLKLENTILGASFAFTLPAGRHN